MKSITLSVRELKAIKENLEATLLGLQELGNDRIYADYNDEWDATYRLAKAAGSDMSQYPKHLDHDFDAEPAIAGLQELLTESKRDGSFFSGRKKTILRRIKHLQEWRDWKAAQLASH